MYRYMYDATSKNAGVLVTKNPEMVAIYLTGTPDVRWTSTQVAFFPRVKTFVRIDQGGPTSPQYVATVFDVEAFAWNMTDAVAATRKCTAPRPTIYCDRNDYRTVPASYTGDLWIAAPGLTDAEAVAFAKTDKRIVAIQNVFATDYDRSIVVDPYWPEKAPVVPPPVTFKVQVERYQSGFGWVLEETFITKPGVRYRARVKAGEIWSPWQNIELS